MTVAPLVIGAAPLFRATLFGDVTISRVSDGHSCAVPRASRQVLGCLALYATARPIRRETLIEMLWPDANPETALGRLRTTLWRLKHGLGQAGDGLVCPDTTTIQLDPALGCVWDHGRFAAGVSRHLATPMAQMTAADFADLDAVLSLYTAPLMAGYDAAWIMPERERFADLYARGLERQIAWFRSCKDQNGMIERARRLLDHDPYREDLHALLITAYAAAGQPRRALHQMRACEDAIQADLGLVPQQARTALRRAMQTEPPQPEPAPDLAKALARLETSIRQLDRRIAHLSAALQPGVQDRA